MKKVVLGSAMFLAGIISVALIFAGSMVYNETFYEVLSAFSIVSVYGLMPLVYVFIVIAFLGLVLAICGIIDK